MDLPGPRPVEQNDALDFRIKRHFDIGRTLSQQPFPIVLRPGADLLRSRRHFSVDLVDHGSQKAALISKL